MLETINVYTNNHFDPAPSTLALALVDGLLVALWLFCLLQLVLARAAARAAHAAHDPAAPLRAGDRFVAGRVELARGESVALRVTVDQDGAEIHGNKGSVNHQWTEVARALEARPFYLRHASGARVRVEPGDADVLLVDALDEAHWVERTKRRFRAQLSPGETAVIEGVIDRGPDPEASAEGYRGGGQGWRLSPLNDKLHASTEGLARRHVLRARSFARALVIVPLLGALALLPVLPAHARAAFGEDLEVPYNGRAFWSSRNSKGQVTEHFGVHFTGSNGTETVDIDSRDYGSLPDGRGIGAAERRVWVRQIAGGPASFTALGRGVTVHVGWWLASVFGMLAVAVHVGRRHVYRRWYERPMNEHGSGPLPKPSGERFATG